MKTAKEVAMELNISHHDFTIFLKTIQFKKIMGTYRINEIQISRMKALLDFAKLI